MSIELRTGRNGKLRSTWYGRYEANGKRYTINLGVRVAGEPPPSLSLREEGDKAFERSRSQAQERLDQTIQEARRKHDATHLVERIYEIKTGEQIKSIALDDLPDEWLRIPRRRKPNERYAAQSRSTLARFTAFVRAQNPKGEEISHVTRGTARAFMEAEEARGVTAKTWNDTLKLLRAAYKYLLPAGGINPFSNLPTRETVTVFRKPFTPEELKAIVDAAREDDFIRRILITGMCTAMRRGDCCLLKWKDVDLGRRFITVKTNKTGVTVSIPIFPMLYDELALRQRSEVYVFPEQAKMYVENPDGITWRVRKILAAAGSRTRQKWGDRRDPGSRDHSRRNPRRTQEGSAGDHPRLPQLPRDLGNVALTAGVPLELVQKVTGHRTTDIVLKHYFQPGGEEFRRALQSAMPKLLTNGNRTPKEEMLEILDRTSAKTWQKDANRLRELVGAL